MSYIQEHLRDAPHWVYRIFSEDDDLLYVGCTSKQPRQRVVSLRGENPTLMRAPLHHWRADLYRTGIEAEAAEGGLIDSLAPPLNRHRSGVAAREAVNPPSPIATDHGLVPPKGRWPKKGTK